MHSNHASSFLECILFLHIYGTVLGLLWRKTLVAIGLVSIPALFFFSIL